MAAKANETERQMVFTSKIVDEATEKINDGIVVKRYQNPWLKSEVGIRRAGVSFRMSAEEQQEYVRCALDIHYFTEKYCKTKREDGSVGSILLRDYQKEILDNFVNNRFNILMASRQVGKTVSSAIFILHTILFSNDKNVMIVANKGDTAIEIVDKVKSIYTLLPFFLKPGVKTWNQKSLTFENGCRIKTSARSKTPAIGFTIDVLYLDEFAHIPSNIIEPYYTAAFPTVSAVQNSKIIITSTPNGMNLFHRLLTDAERPDGDPLKNNYKPLRVYWYQVPGRFVSYIRLNPHKLYQHGVTKDEVFAFVNERFAHLTKTKMEFNMDQQKDVIHVFNNDKCTDEDVKAFTFLDSNGYETSILAIAEVTTWKDEAVKDIGGEDAFNQEYGLRFINSSKSLLSESIIDELLKSKKNYVFEELSELSGRLRFSYEDLKWVDDDSAFLPIKRKEYKIVMSVDISEGLGQDYSIINIFKISEKPIELIEAQKHKYKSSVDFFRLEQIGIYRNNFISVKQLAELLYLVAFEYFNPDNVKIVLELNNYGNTLLAEMPHVFDGNNNYGSSIFVRYKHRIDSVEEKVGLKVGENKNMMVKDYQDLMYAKSFFITNEDNIREITTFVKHVTNSGNVRYAADVGHDDTVMTIVNATSIFLKHEFREMVDEWSSKNSPRDFMDYVNSCLRNMDYVEGVDYGQVLRARRQFMNRPKANSGSNVSGINWFNKS
jgi:hypothetical protein